MKIKWIATRHKKEMCAFPLAHSWYRQLSGVRNWGGGGGRSSHVQYLPLVQVVEVKIQLVRLVQVVSVILFMKIT